MATERNEYDFYPTPVTVVDSLFKHIDQSKVQSFLEPCRADGVIYNRVNCCIKTYCEIRELIPKDYLKRTMGKFDLIVTNPPFSIAEDFLRKSIKECDDKGCVAYLLRINFLGSQKRKKLWQEIGTPNKFIVLSKRPSFTGKGTDSTEYAWFIWDRGNIINLPNGIHIE